MSTEKRSYVRISTRLKAYARRASSIDTPLMFRMHPSPLVEDMRNAKLPEGVVGFLQDMDRKLDTILSLLSRDQIKDDFPLAIEVLELSGAGMKFRSEAPIDPDGIYEVVLVLERVPLRMAGAKGIVIGREKETGWYRFEFGKINENDLESIIQFVFQRQREQIRSERRE